MTKDPFFIRSSPAEYNFLWRAWLYALRFFSREISLWNRYIPYRDAANSWSPAKPGIIIFAPFVRMNGCKLLLALLCPLAAPQSFVKRATFSIHPRFLKENFVVRSPVHKAPIKRLREDDDKREWIKRDWSDFWVKLFFFFFRSNTRRRRKWKRKDNKKSPYCRNT